MPNFAANLTMLFTEHEPHERFGAAAAAGFTAVEMQSPQDIGSPAEVATLVADAGVRMVQLNVWPGDLGSGEPMLTAHPHQVEAFARQIEIAAEYAATLGVDVVTVHGGDRVEGAGFAQQVQTLTANLHAAADAMAPHDVTVVLEVLNSDDRPQALLATQDDAAKVLAGVDRANVGLQFDVYHAARMGDDPVDALHRHASILGHIQFADTPDRHEPGTGTLDFAAIFSAIDELGYSGWVSAEYRPSGPTVDSLAWLR